MDDKVAESIVFRDKSFKKFKGSKLIVDKENYKDPRYEVKKLIVKIKKKNFFETQLAENNGKSKTLWKTQK